MPTQAEIDFFTQNGTLTPHHIIGGVGGVERRESYTKKIDANNEGKFIMIEKGGQLVEVQVA